MQLIWSFIQYQLLGMGWLNSIFGNLLAALGIDASVEKVTAYLSGSRFVAL